MSSYVEGGPAAGPNSAAVLGTVLTSENVAQQAKGFAQDRAAEIKRDVSDGHWSLKLLSLLAALAMMIVSVLGFVGHTVTLHWVAAIFDFYTFVLGIVMIILEYGHQLTFFQKIQQSLYKNANFLKYVWGRGLLYCFAGTLVFSQNHMVDLIVGACVCCVGIAYIWVGRTATKKLGEMRRSTVTPEVLQQKFAQADVDGKGALDMEQFRGLTHELGMDLTRREAESVFLQLDCENQGRVQYETVLQWWNNEATETDDFQATAV